MKLEVCFLVVVIPGEGNGNPLQCSCLENPRDRGAWQAAPYGVARSRTRLKQVSMHPCTSLLLTDEEMVATKIKQLPKVGSK